MLLLADPVIMITPEPGATYERWTAFRDYLLECDDLMREGNEITISELCVDPLYSSDRFPDNFHQLAGWLEIEDFENQELDASMMFRLINRLLEQPGLAERLHISYELELPDGVWITGEPLLLIEHNQVSIKPPEVISRLNSSKDLAPAFHLTGGLIAYAACYPRPPLINVEDFGVLTLNSDGTTPLESIEIEVTLIEHTERKEKVGIVAVVNPKSVSMKTRRESSILDYSEDADQMFRFIHDRQPFALLPPYCFASTFLPSLKDMHIIRRETELIKVFDGIRTLLVRHMTKPDPQDFISPPIEVHGNHHLVDGSQQIKDGDWEAWRYAISGQVYKLHYWWRSQDRYFLLSKIVGEHNDMTIAPNTMDKPL